MDLYLCNWLCSCGQPAVYHVWQNFDVEHYMEIVCSLGLFVFYL